MDLTVLVSLWELGSTKILYIVLKPKLFDLVPSSNPVDGAIAL